MPLSVRQNARGQHDGVAGGQRGHFDHRGVLAAERIQNLVVQPFHRGMLLPEQLDAGPALVFLPARLDFPHHRIPVQGQDPLVVVGLDFRRQALEPLQQVRRRIQVDFLPVIQALDLHLTPRLLLRKADRRFPPAVIVGEQRRQFRDVLGRRGGMARRRRDLAQQRGQERVIRLGSAAKGLREGFRPRPFLHRGTNGRFLRLGRVQAGELRRVADVFLNLLVLLDQDFQDALVAADPGMAAFRQQVVQEGLLLLAVAVDAPVSLLERQQRPRNVEMDQPVAEIVEVDAFRCHVRRHQQPQRRGFIPEGLHQRLLLHVGHVAARQRGDLVLFQPQIGLQAFAQEFQGGDAFGEDYQPVVLFPGAPTDALRGIGTEHRQQGLVFGEFAGPDFRQQAIQAPEGFLVGSVAVRVGPALDAPDALLDGLHAGGRTGKQGFFEQGPEQQFSGPGPLVDLLELRVGQAGVGRFLGCAGRMRALVHGAVGEVAPHLVLHVLLEAPDEQAFDVRRAVVGRILDGGRIQHVHDAGEGFLLPVVRRRRQQDQRVRPRRQQGRHLGPHGVGAALGHVVRLVDHDHVPPGFFEMVPVFPVLLDGVDGDDRLVEIVERIVVGRNPRTDPLQAGGIQPDQRNRKTRPQFLLELGHHGLHRQHQDAPPAPPPDHFRQQDAAFDGLAQSYGIRDQDALAGLLEGQPRGIQLEGHQVHRPAVSDHEAGVRRHRLPQERFEEQPGVAVVRRGIRHRLGIFGIHHLDRFAEFLFNGVDELGVPVAHQRRQPRHRVHLCPRLGLVRQPDQPLLPANNNPASGRDGNAGRGFRHNLSPQHQLTPCTAWPDNRPISPFCRVPTRPTDGTHPIQLPSGFPACPIPSSVAK